ncbi:MAG: hypothetical protein L0331_10075 [Chloroflexi bacterium]|nr:hypothetical protein [Chloroflexota bacterium]
MPYFSFYFLAVVGASGSGKSSVALYAPHLLFRLKLPIILIIAMPLPRQEALCSPCTQRPVRGVMVCQIVLQN